MSDIESLFVCLIGVDGSGKTTQARALVEHLHSLDVSAGYVWSRGDPWITKPLIFFGRCLLRRYKTRGASEKQHDGYVSYLTAKDNLFRIPVVRWLWAQCSFLEHHIQIRRKVYPLLRSSRVVIADRYIFDTVVDVIAGSYQTKTEPVARLLRQPFVANLRQPDVIFLLDVDVPVALQRKSDIPDGEYLTRRKILYAEIACCTEAILINANQGADKVFRDIFQPLSGCLSLDHPSVDAHRPQETP